MKKPYTKPLISVEAMTLDQPIALNCTADRDIMEILVSFGYFMNDAAISCDPNMMVSDGNKVDSNLDGVVDDHDTICYHGNIQQAFMS